MSSAATGLLVNDIVHLVGSQGQLEGSLDNYDWRSGWSSSGTWPQQPSPETNITASDSKYGFMLRWHTAIELHRSSHISYAVRSFFLHCSNWAWNEFQLKVEIRYEICIAFDFLAHKPMLRIQASQKISPAARRDSLQALFDDRNM